MSRARWFDDTEYLEGSVVRRWPPWQKPPRGALLNRTHPLARGLVGAWVMNEGAGNIVNDLVEQNNLTPINANYIWNDNALEITNADTYFEGVDSPGYSPVTTGKFTVVGNFYPTSNTGTRYIIAKCGTSNFEWEIRIQTGGSYRIYVLQLDASTHAYVTGSAVVVNEWIQLAFTYDSSYGLIWYEDGFFKGEDTSLDGAIGDGTATLKVGTRTGGSGAIGRHGYWYIYNRALSPTEIAQLYREPYGMFL